MLVSNGDILRALIMGGAFAGIYGFARWASRKSESAAPALPPESELVKPEPVLPQWSKVVPIDSRGGEMRKPAFERTEPLTEESLLPVRITRVYFATFDYEPGPPDPANFADEMFVELYNNDSGYS